MILWLQKILRLSLSGYMPEGCVQTLPADFSCLAPCIGPNLQPASSGSWRHAWWGRPTAEHWEALLYITITETPVLSTSVHVGSVLWICGVPCSHWISYFSTVNSCRCAQWELLRSDEGACDDRSESRMIHLSPQWLHPTLSLFTESAEDGYHISPTWWLTATWGKNRRQRASASRRLDFHRGQAATGCGITQ